MSLKKEVIKVAGEMAQAAQDSAMRRQMFDARDKLGTVQNDMEVLQTLFDAAGAACDDHEVKRVRHFLGAMAYYIQTATDGVIQAGEILSGQEGCNNEA